MEIWRLAIEYGEDLYKVADSLPSRELYGLGSQLRRVAVSISSNIAEGSGSASVADFGNFLNISIESVLESASQLEFALLRGYISREDKTRLYEKAEKIVRKIRSFKRSLTDR